MLFFLIVVDIIIRVVIVILTVVVLMFTCSNHPQGWRYRMCSGERQGAGYCNPENLQVETNRLNLAKKISASENKLL